ncbi:MAG: hypothetical protein K1X89_13365 [Myxococcaceae bacterium]|nr:hypothetical protein [Myxococcaceae bacterium]
MATLTLRLEVDPVTKKKNVLVKLESDSDALPHEHEQAHKAIVEALLKGGTLKAEELGQVIITREGVIPVKEPSKPDEVPAAPEAARSKG